jgi:hypothetical protein
VGVEFSERDTGSEKKSATSIKRSPLEGVKRMGSSIKNTLYTKGVTKQE